MAPATHPQGDRSIKVQQLQIALIQAGLMAPARIRFHAGIFGRHTETAVSALQVINARDPTGLYDDQSREDLSSMLQKRYAESAADTGAETVAVVQGTPELLIPHEILMPGVSVVPKVVALLWEKGKPGAVSAQLSEAQHLVSVFAKDSAQRSLRLSAKLSENERAVLHTIAAGLCLGHTSTGEASKRSMLLWKPLKWQKPPSPNPGAAIERRKNIPKTVAIIEIADGREVSRGFVVSSSWCYCAHSLVSRTEPRFIARRCKAFAATDIMDPMPLKWTVVGEPGCTDTSLYRYIVVQIHRCCACAAAMA